MNGRSLNSLGPSFEQFSEKYLRHVAGPWAGQSFGLEPWQRDWVKDLFALKEDGGFQYQQALLGIARGNGKSTLASALALYALFYLSQTDPGAEVYALAGGMAQARIVFGEAKKMVEASPLVDWVRLYRDSIYVPDTGATFRVIPSGRPELLHGLKPSFFVGDEIHGWNDPELWYAMSTAQLKRPNSLGIGISTAGFDQDTILGELYKRGKEGEDGFLFRWFEAENADDPATWKDANPSSWITQAMLEREAKRTPPAVFNRLHLNKWTRAVESWLPRGSWADTVTEERIEPGESVFVGLDLGFKTDHTAIVKVARRDEKYIAETQTFATHADASKQAPLATHVFENERQSHQAVLEAILDIAKDNPIEEVVYDPFGAGLIVEELEFRGILCVEYPQSNARMTKATDVLYGHITTGKLLHPDDPVFTSHVEAATVKWVGQGQRLWKTPDRQPMDAAIALALALARAHETKASGGFNFWTL